MGRFQSLSQVGLVLAEVIQAAVPAGTEIRLNVPIDDPAAAAPAVRLTLMWTTPQPAHRSDPEERNPDGTMAPPPPTLTAFYVISTNGATDDQNAIGAHDLLGQIIRALHVQPTLELPIDGMGEGRLHVAQVPTDADLTEKIWTPLQVRQRPWALFDVNPIQLLRTEAPGPEQPVVHPGGIRLAPVEVATRPHIERVAPSVVGRGGRIRLDASYIGPPARVTAGDARIIPPDIAAMAPDGPVLVTLPPTLVEGTYDLTLTAAGLAPSDPVTVRIVEATRPSIDAPANLRHSRGVNLVLEGRALGTGAATVFFWPDAGIASPADVVTAAGNAADTTLTIPTANLVDLRNEAYRISLRHTAHGFTPYVVLEIAP